MVGANSLFTLVNVDTIGLAIEAKTVFTFALFSPWRHALLVNGTKRILTLSADTVVTVSKVSLHAATHETSFCIETLSILVATGFTITFVDVETKVSLELVETIASVTTFTVFAFGVFRADAYIFTLVDIDTGQKCFH